MGDGRRSALGSGRKGALGPGLWALGTVDLAMADRRLTLADRRRMLAARRRTMADRRSTTPAVARAVRPRLSPVRPPHRRLGRARCSRNWAAARRRAPLSARGW